MRHVDNMFLRINYKFTVVKSAGFDIECLANSLCARQRHSIKNNLADECTIICRPAIWSLMIRFEGGENTKPASFIHGHLTESC